MIRRLHWKLAHHFRSWGVERVLGGSMLLMAAFVYAYTYLEIETRHDEAVRQVRQIQTDSKSIASPIRSTRNPLDLPASSTALASLGQLQQLAQENGLVFESGQFRQEPGKDLVRYRISLPVIGGYVDVRSFLAQSMERFPNLALEGLSISREEPGMEEVDAVLQMSFYFRP